MVNKFQLLALTVAIGVLSHAAQAEASLLAGGALDDNSDLAAWTIGGSSLPAISNGAFGLAPQAGAGYLGFTGNGLNPGGFVSQTVPVSIGQSYRLEFYWGGRGIGGAQVTVSGDGSDLITQEFTADTIGVWTKAILDFQATSSSVLIKFQETTVDSVNKGPGIDTVSLVAVPEPTTIIVWSLLGLAGTGIWRRKASV